MNCQWCNREVGVEGEEQELEHRRECRNARHDKHNRIECGFMYECHDAIQALKRGEQVHVSDGCMERFGKNIRYWREHGTKKKRDVSL